MVSMATLVVIMIQSHVPSKGKLTWLKAAFSRQSGQAAKHVTGGDEKYERLTNIQLMKQLKEPKLLDSFRRQIPWQIFK
jgi:hypothetical protein